MILSGNDGHRLKDILAEMIRSALAWDSKNATPSNATGHVGQEGIDGVSGTRTLSTIKRPRPLEAEESGEL